MVATGSNSFQMQNVKVNKSRCFKIDADAVTLQNKLYKYPFRQLAEATLAANIMGMAIHFVDLAEEIIQKRTALGKFTEAQQTFLSDKLTNIKNEIAIIRERFYKAVDESWELNIQPTLNQVSITSRKLAQTADCMLMTCILIAV